MSEFTTEVNIPGEECGTLATVEYRLSGKYYPETRMQPADYPDIEITAVKVDRGVLTDDVLPVLSENEVERLVQMIHERESEDGYGQFPEGDEDDES